MVDTTKLDAQIQVMTDIGQPGAAAAQDLRDIKKLAVGTGMLASDEGKIIEHKNIGDAINDLEKNKAAIDSSQPEKAIANQQARIEAAVSALRDADKTIDGDPSKARDAVNGAIDKMADVVGKQDALMPLEKAYQQFVKDGKNTVTLDAIGGAFGRQTIINDLHDVTDAFARNDRTAAGVATLTRTAVDIKAAVIDAVQQSEKSGITGGETPTSAPTPPASGVKPAAQGASVPGH